MLDIAEEKKNISILGVLLNSNSYLIFKNPRFCQYKYSTVLYFIVTTIINVY